MLLHGHTHESIKGIPTEDLWRLYEHCASGLMGPITPGLIGFRTASYLRSLQGTVLSIVSKSRPSTRLRMGDAYPEVAALAEVRRAQGAQTLQADAVHSLMARLTARFDTAQEEDHEGNPPAA